VNKVRLSRPIVWRQTLHALRYRKPYFLTQGMKFGKFG
jgi:hypothetical protein